MQSNIHKFEKGTRIFDEIFAESEKVAKYNELSHRHALELRLLCEELVNMLPSIVSDFSGEFWIENQNDYYELCVKVFIENMDFDTRERLINVSKNNKNSAAVGISGKIRDAFEYMTIVGNDPMISPAGRFGFSSNIDFSQIWSLKQYQEKVQENAEIETEAWDEIEKSIIAKLADDVIVGIKGKTVNIIIKKKFA